jgi:enoyl-CoA hydratase/carnithine racemase
MRIAALDEWLSPRQALDRELVYRIVSPEQLTEEALSWATRLAKRSSYAFATFKQLLSESWNTPLKTQLGQKRQGFVRTIVHPNGQAELFAFLEKRPPRFA